VKREAGRRAPARTLTRRAICPSKLGPSPCSCCWQGPGTLPQGQEQASLSWRQPRTGSKDLFGPGTPSDQSIRAFLSPE